MWRFLLSLFCAVYVSGLVSTDSAVAKLSSDGVRQWLHVLSGVPNGANSHDYANGLVLFPSDNTVFAAIQTDSASWLGEPTKSTGAYISDVTSLRIRMDTGTTCPLGVVCAQSTVRCCSCAF